MAPSGVAPTTETPQDLAREAAEIAAETKSLRNTARRLAQRAAALQQACEDAGIGFRQTTTTAREGEGDTR
jgi:hypothetical protein